MGEITRRGLDAYKQSMAPLPPENDTAPVNRQADTEGLLKTTIIPSEKSRPARARRVAQLLVLIGSEQAAQILAELDEDLVEEISREIAMVRGIGEEEAESVLTEFKSLLTSPAKDGIGYSGGSVGGVETARRILYAAYGPEKGETLLNKTVPESKENIFGFLEEFEPEQLVFLLKDESPAATALILARLPPKTSAETLGKLPAALKPEITKRIARRNDVAPDILERVAGALREKARFLGSGGSKDITIDGMNTLAAILKQGDYSFGDRIINELETQSPDMGKDLKDMLYTLDDVLAAFDRPLAGKLKTMSDRDIAILLKGRSSAFREKILSNVSTGRRDIIREEGDIIGAVPRRDCDEAAQHFLAWFRQARENGDLTLTTDDDWVL